MEADVTRVAAAAGMPILATLTGTATLEGGSFVKLRDGVAALGTSIRCNDDLMAVGSPRTEERLRDAGVEVRTIPYDELQHNGGGVHCSTMELVRERAAIPEG